MDIIITFEGDDLAELAHLLHSADTHRLRVAIDCDAVKVKANEYCWSPPLRNGAIIESRRSA